MISTIPTSTSTEPANSLPLSAAEIPEEVCKRVLNELQAVAATIGIAFSEHEKQLIRTASAIACRETVKLL